MLFLDNMPTIAELIIEKKEQRANYIIAEQQILKGAQSYSIGNRTLTRANLEFIAKRIDDLNSEINQLQRGNVMPIQRAVPRDI